MRKHSSCQREDHPSLGTAKDSSGGLLTDRGNEAQCEHSIPLSSGMLRPKPSVLFNSIQCKKT